MTSNVIPLFRRTESQKPDNLNLDQVGANSAPTEPTVSRGGSNVIIRVPGPTWYLTPDEARKYASKLVFIADCIDPASGDCA